MTSATTSVEHDWLQRIAAGDALALATLYDRYGQPLFALALRIVGSREEAEEVVLDVFCQVWRTSPAYDPQRGRVDGWLFAITRNRALDHRRRLQRHDRQTGDLERMPLLSNTSAGTDPEEWAVIAERRQTVHDAMSSLPEEQRHVMELAYFSGLSHSEIASRTGMHLGTVKTRIRLAMDNLRKALSPFWGG